MAERSIAQAADFISSSLTENDDLAQFSALSSSEKTTSLYSIYSVLAQGHALTTASTSTITANATATASTPAVVNANLHEYHNNKVKYPTLPVTEQSLIQYLELTKATATSPPSTPPSSTSTEHYAAANQDLEWAIVGLAALAVYGNTITSLKNQTLPLSQDLLYWDSVLYGDHDTRSVFLYYLQQLPFDLYSWIKKHMLLAKESSSVSSSISLDLRAAFNTAKSILKVVKRVRKRLRKTVSSPVSVLLLLYSPLDSARAAVKTNRNHILALRNSSAQTLGFLVGQGFNVINSQPQAASARNWTALVSSNVTKMKTALAQDTEAANEIGISAVPSLNDTNNARSAAQQLLTIIQQDLPLRTSTYKTLTAQYGQPSRVKRYWPAAVGLGVATVWAGKSVIGNWDAIVHWLRTQVVDTAIAFYYNWIVSPLTKIYQTIRHDSNAQVALMTQQSLEADMRSLERMVVAFAEVTGNGSNPADAEVIRASVQQGDISSVLIPYEQQIQTPFKSALAGQLVQALLIQVQKTKVDVEVAVSGIDKILKSQELVFGVVAALPSLLVSGWLLKWASSVLMVPATGRASSLNTLKRGVSESVFVVLGRIDRLLLVLSELSAAATTTTDETVVEQTQYYYETLGLLLCETGLLRDLGHTLLPLGYKRQWDLDLTDLEDMCVHGGGAGAREVLQRVYNVYSMRLFFI